MKKSAALWKTKKAGIWLFIAFTMAGRTGFAALPDFTLTITATDETCIANGSLSWITSGTAPGAVIVYAVYKAPDYNTAVATTSETTYTGLKAGTYRVIATQTLEGESNSAQKSTEIYGRFQPLDYTVTTGYNTCGEGRITVNLKSGKVSSYALTEGPETREPQLSNVFDNLQPGTYTVTVIDSCGNIKNQSGYTIENLEKGLNVWRSIYPTATPPSCDSTRVQINLRVNSDFSIAYPVVFTFTIDPPGGGAAEQFTRTLETGGNSQTNFDIMIPYYPGQSFNITATDACGMTASRNETIHTLSPMVYFRKIEFDCSSCALAVNWRGGGITPYQIEFLTAPAGFNPADYTADWGRAYTSTETVYFGTEENPVPSGSYTIKITDACNRSSTTSISTARPPISTSTYTYKGCSGNENYLQMDTSPLLASVQVTNAPSGFAHSLPYTMTAIDNYYRLTAVPEGNYTFLLTDTCGSTVTESHTLTNYIPGTVLVTKTENCGNFDLSVEISGTNTLSTTALQRYYPISNKWGHPFNGTTQTPGTKITATNSLTIKQNHMTGAATINTIEATGLFRVVRYRTTYNSNWSETQCVDIIEEFSFNQTLSMGDIYAFPCEDGTSIDVGVHAEGGLTPLTYRITEKDGVEFLVNNGTKNLFTGLAPGVYNFEVMDACGNTFNALHDITKLKLPKITTTILCNGDNGELSVEGVPYLNFVWWKKDAPGITLSTGHSLQFTPFNATQDEGEYCVHLTSPEGSSCVNEVLEFYLSQNTDLPKAGKDTTVVLQGNIQSVDLRIFLSGEYDEGGTFTETTIPTSGYLGGHTFYALNYINPGTYTFKYTVEGVCDGTTDEAVITLIVKPNYWLGTENTDWNNPNNWSRGRVPYDSDDVEFATEINNPTIDGNPTSGPAQNDLYVPSGTKVIYNKLINESDFAVVVPPETCLVIEESGTIIGSETIEKAHRLIIKAESGKAGGTFLAPCGRTIYATVQLYSKAHKADTEDEWVDDIAGSPTYNSSL